MRLVILLITFVTLSLGLRAKQQLVDSLVIEAATNQFDTAKIDVFNELAWVLQYDNTNRALAYADSAIIKSQLIGYRKGEATGYVRAGLIKMKLGANQEALTLYQKALKIEESIQNVFGIARASNQLSLIHKTLGNFSQSIQYGKKAIAMLRITEKPRPTQLANSLNNLGAIYIELSVYDSALLVLSEALNIRKQLNSEFEVAKSHLNFGYLYEKTKDYEESLEFSKMAEVVFKKNGDLIREAQTIENQGNVYYKTGQWDNAEASYLRSLNLRKSLHTQEGVENSYSNLALIYESKNDLTTAVSYLIQSLEIRERSEDLNGIIISNINLGNVRLKQGQITVAEQRYLTAFGIVKENKNFARFPEILSHLTSLYSNTNRPVKALEFSLLYNETKDEMGSAFRKIKDLEIDIEKERNRNAELEQQEKYFSLENRNKSLKISSLVAGIILLIVLIIVLIGYFRLKQKKTLAEKNQRIKQQENEKLIKTQELSALGAMLEGQEKERRRIAKDLHDRLGSMLSVVKIHFKSVEQNLDELKLKNREQYEKANRLLDDACDEVRKVAHDMVSGVLMKFGVVSALRNLCSSVESTGQLKMELIDFGLDERLDYRYEITIYRIIQELLSNVLKHAHASEMTIQLLKKEDTLNIIIEDNGIGFDQDSEGFEPGMGLKNIESRVHKYNGELAIDSGKGAGTTITIELEIQKLTDD